VGFTLQSMEHHHWWDVSSLEEVKRDGVCPSALI